MATKRTKKEIQEGVTKYGNMIDKMMDQYLGKILHLDLTCIFLYTTDPANQPRRSKLSVLLGLIPHLVIFVFAAYIVWLAKPSSSKSIVV